MSGHLFTDTSTLTGREWKAIHNDIAELVLKTGANEVVPVGSAATAGDDTVMGDIDLAVQHPGGRAVLIAALQKRFDIKVTGKDLASVRYPLDAHRWVQLDLMVGNPKFLQWSRAGASPEHPDIKGSARALLLNAITRLYAELYLFEGSNVYDRERYVLDFGSGYYLVNQTRLGKKGNVLKSWKTVKSKFVTDSPTEIVDHLFRPVGTATPAQTRHFVGVVEAFNASTIYLSNEMRAIAYRQLWDELVALDAKSPGMFGNMQAIRRFVPV